MTNIFYARVDNKSHVFIRIESGFYDITDCHVLNDGEVPGRDGLLPDAQRVSDEEVTELVAQHEKHNDRLASSEVGLRKWIDLRRSRTRRGNSRFRLQRKEVSA